MNNVHVCIAACPAHWAASPSISPRFFLSLTSGGGRGEQFSLDRRTDSHETHNGKYIKQTFWSADWTNKQTNTVCFLRRGWISFHLKLFAPQPFFWGGGEARRRMGTQSSSSAKLTMRRSEQRQQGDNTDPRVHWGAAISHLCFLFLFEAYPRVAFPPLKAIFLFCWTDWD